MAVFANMGQAAGNIIPYPWPASMPFEEMAIQIEEIGDVFRARFTGDFTFEFIPEDVASMMFPVPPGATITGVWMDGEELPWRWNSEIYPTVLPEMPGIPMIEWDGPFPVGGAVFTVAYDHELIQRENEWIYFYAVGTGKYFPTYDTTTTANFELLLPRGMGVGGVWLDEEPHEYERIEWIDRIIVQSEHGPIRNDLIVSLVPDLGTLDCNENGVPDGFDLKPAPEFGEATTVAAFDNNVYTIGAADWDGDGDTDVVASDYEELTFLWNRGDGTFDLGDDLPIDSRARDILSTDFDGDGDLDLAASRSEGILVLLNDGDGSFTEEVAFDVCGLPETLASGDLNGDGAEDLVAVTRSNDALAVVLNNGDGTFDAPGQCVLLAGYTGNAAIVDMDGDGDRDVVTCQGYDGVSVLRNESDGTFADLADVYDVDTYCHWVTPADFDGDGHIDVAVVDGSASVWILFGDGEGGLGSPMQVPVGARPYSAFADDLHGDGIPDLIVTFRGWLSVDPWEGPHVFVLPNPGSGLFTWGRRIVTGAPRRRVAVVDLNGDLLPDLVGLKYYEPKGLVVLLNETASPISVDMNGNGSPDECDCETAAECDDGDPCTVDTCENERCVNEPVTCDDGVFCNGRETCIGGDCVAGEPPCGPDEICLEAEQSCVECLADEDCDDGDSCTIDVCEDASCVYSRLACDDGVFCNGEESCVGGRCVTGAPPCDDGLICLEESQTCVQCMTDSDCDDGDPCTWEACEDQSCVRIPMDCDDGVFCNGQESCVNGTCVAGQSPCAEEFFCSEELTSCVACLADGHCDDGAFCNGVEACMEGECIGGTAPCRVDQTCDEDADRCVAPSAARRLCGAFGSMLGPLLGALLLLRMARTHVRYKR